MTKNISIELKGKTNLKPNFSEVQVSVKDNRVIVSGLPDQNVLEYIAVSPSKRFYVVHRPEKNWKITDIRLHIGTANQLEEAVITGASRYQDANPTHIDYLLNNKKGNISLPTPFSHSTPDSINGFPDELSKLEVLFMPKKEEYIEGDKK